MPYGMQYYRYLHGFSIMMLVLDSAENKALLGNASTVYMDMDMDINNVQCYSSSKVLPGRIRIMFWHVLYYQ